MALSRTRVRVASGQDCWNSFRTTPSKQRRCGNKTEGKLVNPDSNRLIQPVDFGLFRELETRKFRFPEKDFGISGFLSLLKTSQVFRPFPKPPGSPHSPAHVFISDPETSPPDRLWNAASPTQLRLFDKSSLCFSPSQFLLSCNLLLYINLPVPTNSVRMKEHKASRHSEGQGVFLSRFNASTLVHQYKSRK